MNRGSSLGRTRSSVGGAWSSGTGPVQVGDVGAEAPTKAQAGVPQQGVKPGDDVRATALGWALGVGRLGAILKATFEQLAPFEEALLNHVLPRRR